MLYFMVTLLCLSVFFSSWFLSNAFEQKTALFESYPPSNRMTNCVWLVRPASSFCENPIAVHCILLFIWIIIAYTHTHQTLTNTLVYRPPQPGDSMTTTRTHCSTEKSKSKCPFWFNFRLSWLVRRFLRVAVTWGVMATLMDAAHFVRQLSFAVKSSHFSYVTPEIAS